MFDLWLNAKRRAAQGRYDDAVARTYRLLEWTAQWQLRSGLDLDTSDFPSDMLPDGVRAGLGRDGKSKTGIGLYSAWRVIGERLDNGPVKAFATERAGEMRNFLGIRNNSILAHGFRPVQRTEWAQMESWIEDRFLPMLRQAATDAVVQREENR